MTTENVAVSESHSCNSSVSELHTHNQRVGRLSTYVEMAQTHVQTTLSNKDTRKRFKYLPLVYHKTDAYYSAKLYNHSASS